MTNFVRSRRLVLAACCLAGLAAASLVAAERSARAMTDAATGLLSSLTPDQRSKAAFPFASDQRTRWNFIPTEAFPRQGLTLGEMTDAQRSKVHDLLKAGLSQRGYLTATAIMSLEDVLGALEAAQRQAGRQAEGFRRDPLRYFVSVFGTPSRSGAWGWRVEGHHVSLHFTVVDGRLTASTPTMFGSNPAEVREGPKKGLRILAAEEDSARALLAALDDAQRRTAIITGTALNEIVTTNRLDVSPLSPPGIAARALTPAQRDLLMKVIDVYAGFMADDVAAERMAALRKAGVDAITFAWAGGTARGEKHYYRVQGPTFLIEYDNAQNDGNHIHSVWRDFGGDFGRDLLREHLATTTH